MLCACKWSKLCHGPVVNLSYATKLYHVKLALSGNHFTEGGCKKLITENLELGTLCSEHYN